MYVSPVSLRSTTGKREIHYSRLRYATVNAVSALPIKGNASGRGRALGEQVEILSIDVPITDNVETATIGAIP